MLKRSDVNAHGGHKLWKPLSSRRRLQNLAVIEMSPAISSPPRTIEASSASPPQAEPIRDPQKGKVFVGLASLYVSLASTSALRWEEHDNSVSRPSVWMTKAIGVLLVILTACRWYLVSTHRSRRSKKEGPPAIHVDDFDSIDQSVRGEEALATSAGSSTAGSAVSGTLQPPILQHAPESAPWRGALTAQPPSGSGSQPSGPSRQFDVAEATLLDVVPSQPNVGHPAGGRSRHAVAPVEQTPPPHAWLQEATSQSPATTPSQSAAWGTPSEWALHQWTFFLPLDRERFGRVRKQAQDTRAIFSSPNCDVWKCEVEFTKPSNEHPDKVAVKVVRHFVRDEHDPVKVLERMNARLNQEAITWAAVGNHPNIVPLIGVIFSPILALILPWYSNGNLCAYLTRYPEANRLKLIHDIAKGLEHLHSCTPKIVQADIKPENVLINDRGDALITDFGMATVLGEDSWYTPSHRHGGTTQWMAPEIFLGQSDRRSRTGDVYSYGSLTCYIMTDRIPHDSRSLYQVLSMFMDATNPQDPIDQWDVHPRFQDSFGSSIAGIIRRCWFRIPRDRPLMQTIVEELSQLTEQQESLIAAVPPSLEDTKPSDEVTRNTL
ncbi:hypothetical protein FRC00_010647 [Tulasnella sp. 408]|nr:hypothetical protein FRC00_010647 [Tulasnella sp. 408]